MTKASSTDVSNCWAASKEHRVVTLDDPECLASRLAEALTAAKVDELQRKGLKALPLTSFRCSIEYHGPPDCEFQAVELRTNYDLGKLSGLQVDDKDQQKLLDKRATGPCLVRAVPVVLYVAQPCLHFVFSYVLPGACSMANWSLKNSRGQEVSFLDGDTRGSLRSFSSVLPGCPSDALAHIRCGLDRRVDELSVGEIVTRSRPTCGPPARTNRKRTGKRRQSIKSCAVSPIPLISTEGMTAEDIKDDIEVCHAGPEETLRCVNSPCDAPNAVEDVLPCKYEMSTGSEMTACDLSNAATPRIGESHSEPLDRGVLSGETRMESSELLMKRIPHVELEVECGAPGDARGQDGLHAPETERLLRGWQVALWASEACSTWDGPRLGDGRGSRYWCAKRNENACWRRCFVERQGVQTRKPASPRTPTTDSESGSRALCDSCFCAGKLCSCQPDPLQPLRTLEPESPDPVTEQPVFSEESQTTGIDAAWRNLLRGTHAFSLQGAPENISLHPDNPDEALVARTRHKNVAWRRWWATQRGDSWGPSVLFPPTPTSSQPGTPRSSLYPQPLGIDVGVASHACPMVYVPVPLHLAGAIQRYAAELQAVSSVRQVEADTNNLLAASTSSWLV